MSKKQLKRPEMPDSFFEPRNEKLKNLIIAGSYEKDCKKPIEKLKLAGFFFGMRERDRRSYAPIFLEWITVFNEDVHYKGGTPEGFPKKIEAAEVDHALMIVVVSCCNYSEIEKLGKRMGGWNLDIVYEQILRDRKPDWGGEFVFSLVRAESVGQRFWKMYRRLLADDIIAPPENHELNIEYFITKFTHGLERKTGKKEPSIFGQLREDRAFVKHELRQLFELDNVPNSLVYLDMTYGNDNTLKNAICRFIETGEVPAENVLEACLGMIEKPLKEFVCKWYTALMEKMHEKGLVDKFVVSESPRILELMNHQNTAPRVFGAKIFESLFKTGSISDKDVLENVSQLLREPQKTRARKTIGMLDKIAERNPKLRKEVLEKALEGLAHENSEVQTASFSLISKYGGTDDPEIMNSVRKFAHLLSPSVRKSIPDSVEKEKKTIVPVSETINKVTEKEMIVPIEDVDELLDLAVNLENIYDDTDQIERLLDGLSRLGYKRTKNFEKRTSAIVKNLLDSLGKQPVSDAIEYYRRHMKINSSWGEALRELERKIGKEDPKKTCFLRTFLPFSGTGIGHDLEYLLLSWLLGAIPEMQKNFLRFGGRTYLLDTDRNLFVHTSPIERLFSDRAISVAKTIVSGKSRQLLSAPTHKGGWISPKIFATRIIESYKSGVVHDESDRVLALLRLDFEGRETALKRIENEISKKDDYLSAVRYALGAEKILIGSIPHYWIAAARARSPLSDDPNLEKRHPGYGPDAGFTARYEFVPELRYIDHIKTLKVVSKPVSVQKNIDPVLFPSVRAREGENVMHGRHFGFFAMSFSIWPQNQNPALACSIELLSESLDRPKDEGYCIALKTIARNDVPFDRMTSLALFLGLGMKATETHTAAIDSMIAIIDSGRFDPEIAGAAACELFDLGRVTLKRLLKPLSVVSEQSSVHARSICEFLERCVHNIDTKNLGGFLELLYELSLSLERRIESVLCREFLEKTTGNGKSGKLAKKLLGM